VYTQTHSAIARALSLSLSLSLALKITAVAAAGYHTHSRVQKMWVLYNTTSDANLVFCLATVKCALINFLYGMRLENLEVI
jgi:hypothetical protein